MDELLNHTYNINSPEKWSCNNSRQLTAKMAALIIFKTVGLVSPSGSLCPAYCGRNVTPCTAVLRIFRTFQSASLPTPFYTVFGLSGSWRQTSSWTRWITKHLQRNEVSGTKHATASPKAFWLDQSAARSAKRGQAGFQIWLQSWSFPVTHHDSSSGVIYASDEEWHSSPWGGGSRSARYRG